MSRHRGFRARVAAVGRSAWTALVTVALALWSLLADEKTGRLDVAQTLFVVGVSLSAYGAWLIFPPAGFLLPGVVLTWWTLPSREPFVRGKDR